MEIVIAKIAAYVALTMCQILFQELSSQKWVFSNKMPFLKAWNAIVKGKGRVLLWCFLHHLILRFLLVMSSTTSSSMDYSHHNEALLSLNFSSSQCSTWRNFTDKIIYFQWLTNRCHIGQMSHKPIQSINQYR